MDQHETVPGLETPRGLKGLARATRTAVFTASEHDCLTRDAEEELFRHADVLSEGNVVHGRFEGSTMVAFDVGRMGGVFRDPVGPGLAARMAGAIAGSVRVHLRVLRMARAEAERRMVGHTMGTLEASVEVRAEGARILVDVTVEAAALEVAANE